jgi:polyhydroxybutyrate depolymerase
VPPAEAPESRFALCTEAPRRLEGPPGAAQSRGCVVRFQQTTTDPLVKEAYGRDTFERRFLVYVPERLPEGPVPLVFVFPGYGASAEAAAFYYTHTRFEQLADRDGFVVVYGNGLTIPPPGEKAAMPEGGFFRGCFSPRQDEGVDVQYVRQIVTMLESKLAIDRTRIYAAGLSAGGGLTFELAMEAPDLIAAIAPVAPLPFQPQGSWRHACHPKAGHERISILMVAGTADRFISYEPGPSPKYPEMHYAGMEQTRDAWLEAMQIEGAPEVELLPDVVTDDSYEPHSGQESSRIELYRYPKSPSGHELRYLKAIGMGHWWPDRRVNWQGIWADFGKNNQDIAFTDDAWEFFREQHK